MEALFICKTQAVAYYLGMICEKTNMQLSLEGSEAPVLLNPKGKPLRETAALVAGRENRFWRQVNKNGPIPSTNPGNYNCWEWQGLKNKGGYGRFYFFGRYRLSHHYLMIPSAKEEKRCAITAIIEFVFVQIIHGSELIWKNIRDCVAKGRHKNQTKPQCVARGEKHWTKTKPELIRKGVDHHYAKVTEAIFILMRQKHDSGSRICDLMREFNMSEGVTRGIVNKLRWKHVL